MIFRVAVLSDKIDLALSEPLKDHRRPTFEEQATISSNQDDIKVDNINFNHKGGTGQDYLLKRLARDYPLALEEIREGKCLTSVKHFSSEKEGYLVQWKRAIAHPPQSIP